MNRVSVLLLLIPAITVGMEPNGRQLEICPGRRAYIQSVAEQRKKAAENPTAEKKCPFCDPDILAANYILSEDYVADVRKILNRHPYFTQGPHILMMSMSHIEKLSDFSSEQLALQIRAAQVLSRKLHPTAHSQEYFFNDGIGGGQSVAHLHAHFKNYTRPPLSLPEQIKESACAQTVNPEAAFYTLKKYLDSAENDVEPEPDVEAIQHNEQCLCCSVSVLKNEEADDENLVFWRGEYNFVCLPHYPNLPGEIRIIPKRHVSSIKDLALKELQENMVLAAALLPKIKEYAQNNIRECGGGNIYIKNIGGLAPIKKQARHHVLTSVMPRTAIVATPGTLDGNSCKLDFDPVHFFEYCKAQRDELSALYQ